MPSTVLVDIAGRRRSPATLPSFHEERPPRNKGLMPYVAFVAANAYDPLPRHGGLDPRRVDDHRGAGAWRADLYMPAGASTNHVVSLKRLARRVV